MAHSRLSHADFDSSPQVEACHTNAHTSEDITFADASPTLGQSVNAGKWSTVEDSRLREAVAKHGTRWIAVASHVGTRNGEQCAKRWNDNVNPDLDHSPWSAHEDKYLMSLVTLYGHNWKLVAENFLQARAPLTIKNRHSLLMRRQARQTRQNVKQQQKRSSTSTSPSEDHDHPYSNFHLVATDLASSPFTVQDHALAASLPGSSSFTNPNTAFDASRPAGTNTTDLSGLLSINSVPGFQNDDGTKTQFALQVPRTVGDAGQVSDAEWDGFDFCNGVDLGSFFGSPDMSIHKSAAGTISPQGPPGDMDGVGGGGNQGVEFSVTCSKSRLKAMVCHAFEGAMSETAGLSEVEPITVTLRLRR